MRRFLLALALLVGTAWPAAAQIPFGVNPATIAPPVVFSAAGGPAVALTLPNNVYAVGVNAAGNGTVNLWKVNTSNQIESGANAVSVSSLLVAATINATGSINTANAAAIYWGTRTLFRAPADGFLNISNNAETIGSQLKVDALPTVGSGFGSTGPPAVIAGSTPFAGAVNVGTGTIAASGTITFGGTAFTSAPFCTVTNQGTTFNALRASATTTVLTIAANPTWTASDIVNWVCVGAK